MTYKMNAAGLTDVGQVRTNNEDSLYIDGPLLIVADGMGGAAAGEVASRLAIEVLSSELSGLSYTNDKETEELLRAAILKADKEIIVQMESDPILDGMGTTLVMGIHLDNRMLIGYVGDSRAYLVTSQIENDESESSTFNSQAEAKTGILTAIGGKKPQDRPPPLRRLTNDHSVVMEMVNSGVIKEADIRTHPMRNRITRCLGSIGSSEPDFVWHDISDGDTIILCSDGMWEMVHEDLIYAIAHSSDIPEDMCSRLVTAANNSGGVDNITVISAMFTKV